MSRGLQLVRPSGPCASCNDLLFDNVLKGNIDLFHSQAAFANGIFWGLALMLLVAPRLLRVFRDALPCLEHTIVQSSILYRKSNAVFGSFFVFFTFTHSLALWAKPGDVSRFAVAPSGGQTQCIASWTLDMRLVGVLVASL